MNNSPEDTGWFRELYFVPEVPKSGWILELSEALNFWCLGSAFFLDTSLRRLEILVGCVKRVGTFVGLEKMLSRAKNKERR